MMQPKIKRSITGLFLTCLCILAIKNNRTSFVFAAEIPSMVETGEIIGTTEILSTTDANIGTETVPAEDKTTAENGTGVEQKTPVTAVLELDLGEYQTEMKVGEKQLLNVTVLPEDATEQKISYASGNPAVAEVNSMGRITALQTGTTEISVSCRQIVEKIHLTVVSAEIELRDIDLGEYPSEMEKGSSQMLSVTMIPEDATTKEIKYKSTNTKVATVNEIGRITAIKEGTAKIKVICGAVKKEFTLKVIKAKSDEIPVTDIEIGDYEEELEVDKTLTLSATVLPSDATDTKIAYKSSDANIATVNSTGEVKGITEGNVIITVSAGKIKKEIPLTVKVAASKIEVNTTYLVLQPGETHQLSAKAIPAKAGQTITYESVSPEIAAVSGGGLVTAKQCGSGTIVVKNEDISTAVTIIVNAAAKEEEKEAGTKFQETKQVYKNEINAENYSVITAEMLKYFYEKNENLTVCGKGYTIQINGGEIENWENELHTELLLKEEKQGISFTLNQCKNMCGKITIRFDKGVIAGRYVYLYNESKDKYELLKEQDVDTMELDTAGKYLITEKKLKSGYIGWVIVALAVVAVMVLSGVYMGVKKKYWFW